MMKITTSECHFIIRNIEARIEWIKDNPDDASEEEGEIRNLKSVLEKLRSLSFEIKEEKRIGYPWDDYMKKIDKEAIKVIIIIILVIIFMVVFLVS